MAQRGDEKKRAGAARPEDRVMDALGFDRTRFLGDETGAAVQALRAERSLGSVTRVVTSAAGSAEGQLRVLLTVLPPSPPVACDAGCAHCCSLRVEATVPEVVRLAEHLRATLDEARLAAVTARVVSLAARVAGLDANARAEQNVPCALLEAGRCVAYEARPFACRGCNASSPVDCEDSLYSPDVTTTAYAPQQALYRYAGTAMFRAFDLLRVQHHVVELQGALARALTSPDAAARWLAGEPVFAPSTPA